MPVAKEKQTVADAVEEAFSDGIKKATAELFDCLITAAGDAQEEAGCRSRYETALRTFKKGHEISGEVVSEVFP
jgi:hypothetical protein